jgi:regulatory protein
VWVLTFDNGETLTVNEDLKSKYGLRPAMDISEDRFLTLKNEAERRAAYDKAIELLSYREHSSRELKTKLQQKGYSASLANEILKQMIAKNYLDDRRFAKLYFRELMRQRKFGPLMIKKKMLEKGVDNKDIDSRLASVSPEEWEQIAGDILNKKMSKFRRKPENMREAMLNQLIRKGFVYDTVRNVINKYTENTE